MTPTLRASLSPSKRPSEPSGRLSFWSATNTTGSTGREEAPEMMHTAEMMKAFAPYRGEAILIPGRSGRYWIQLSDNQPLDVELGDPAMGGHAGLGLGLALARPDKKVMLFDSEGDILMSLGILATVAEQAPPNLYHFLIDN